MNKITPTSTRYFSILAILSACYATSMLPAQAAPGSLSQTPLYVGPAVEPNVVFLSDDSGSMDWEVMTGDTAEGGRFSTTQPDGTNAGSGSIRQRDSNDDGNANCGIHSGSFHGYLYIVEFGSNTYGDDGNDCNTADDEAWRIRNSDYNPIYFDPSKTYEPWAGVDAGGATYGNIAITNAPNDPYNPTEFIDLTQHNSNWLGGTNRATSDRDGDGAADGFRYYTWTDLDSDGFFDDGEETEFLIKNQDSVTQQNFANWFAYHRNREYVTKYAISKSVEELTGVRIGYGTINNNSNNKITVASMNLDPSVGNKRLLMDAVFQTNSASGTPLRHSLRDVGQYFECSSHNFFGSSGTGCPILPAAQAGMCQKNATIMMTDGFYNGGSPALSPSNTDGDGNTAFDGSPYGDNFTNSLADVAMHFYERDLAPGLTNDVPFEPGDKDQAPQQHMVSYTVAFGVTGTLDPGDSKTPGVASDSDPTNGSFSWPNPSSGNAQRVDDLWHAAYNGRGEFYSAQNPDELVTGLKSAFASAAKGQSSAAAVAFNTSTLDTGSVVYQAKFNPSDNWKGELLAINLAGDGSLSSSAWNAGDALDGQALSSRNILTYSGSAGVPFKWASLTVAQQNDLRTNPSGGTDSAAIGQDRLAYLRGDRSDEGAGNNFRLRSSALGDIVHSNPVYVGNAQSGYNDDASIGDGLYSTYQSSVSSRAGVVYIGANDGMLHAFWESDGTEAFAYVPNMLYSTASGQGLHYLTEPQYTHRYYVDLSPTVADVYLGAWKTVLIGGYRAGGRGLFALDVTDPSTFSESNASSIVMWEFTSNDDADLGYSFSKPTMALMENDKWAAVFGNGYNDLGDGEAKLFIYYLDGSGYEEITTGAGSAGSRNGLSTPAVVDIDGNGKADRVYAGDLEGNLWAFDLSNNSATQWDVAYKQGATKKALFNAAIGATAQPITSKPVVARHPTETLTNSTEPNLLVFFGSGQYLVNGDKSSTDTQTFYGVWDDGPNGSQAPYTRSNLAAQTLQANSTAYVRVPTNNAVNYSSQTGWYFDLPTTGERVVVNPKIRGDYVFFNTLIPDPSSCSSQGYGWLMALQLVNGGRPLDPVFDVNNDGVVDDSDLIDSTDAPAGVRLDGIPAGSNFLSNKMYTPDDNGNIDIRTIDVGNNSQAGRISWREVTP